MNKEKISKFDVIIKSGKPFLRYTHSHNMCGKYTIEFDDMKIYGIKNKPYVKRFSTNIYLEPYMIEQLAAIMK